MTKPLFNRSELDYPPLGQRELNVAILGFGVIGQGVARTLCDLELESVNPFRVVEIRTSRAALVDENGLDLRKAVHASQTAVGLKSYGTSQYRELDVAGSPAAADLGDFARNAECVLEVTPTNVGNGGEPALSWIRRWLGQRRHVVTANKGPFVVSLRELRALAAEHGVCLRYSATVGGGVPMLETLEHGLGGNRILSIEGILNGSSNYILDVMHERKVDYPIALAEAQAAGITETDPKNDVEGLDAAAKGVILHNTAFVEELTLERMSVVGISHLTLDDIRAAEAQGKVYRLVVRLEPGKGIVAPRLVPYNAALAIDGAKNVITFTGQRAGDITLSGLGAGQKETASAMLNDLWKVYAVHMRGRENR